jgi:hypothetical protein
VMSAGASDACPTTNILKGPMLVGPRDVRRGKRYLPYYGSGLDFKYNLK